MPGLGAEVVRRMGVIVVTIPSGEIVRAFKTGAIDGAEWIGPWPDVDLGLDKVADYYYHPGFHEPSSNLTLGVNKTLWDGLTPSERALPRRPRSPSSMPRTSSGSSPGRISPPRQRGILFMVKGGFRDFGVIGSPLNDR